MNPANQFPIPVLTDYEIIRQVGRGSYGEVWLARSVVGGFRAVKIVRRASFSEARPFEREFEGITRYEPVSRHHPGLVDILHVGRGDGFFYYVMELADDCRTGARIDPECYEASTLSRMRDRPARLPLGECLRIGAALASALEHLHSEGLVHRDIKPSNIIFVGGEPKFADIGLVTRLGEPATFVGTVGYIPPEGPGQAAADLFSLGKVLYEIGMGKGRESFPELPTDFPEWPDVTHMMAYNQIVLKSCHPDAALRYASAGELMGALEEMREEVKDQGESTRVISGKGTGTGARRGRVVILGGESEQDGEGGGRLKRWGELLRARGVEVEIDIELTPGVAWARALEKRIRGAQGVVVFLSGTGERTPMVAYGLGIAREAARAGLGRPEVMAVRVNGTTSVPRNIALEIEGGILLDWNGPEDDDRLCLAVADRLKNRGMAPPDI